MASLGPGECFGEMALLTGAPRSMSVQALTDLRVLSMRMDRFNRLLRTHGALAVYFAGILSSRLAAMDQAAVSGKVSSDGGAGGPMTFNEKVSLLVAVISLAGFAAEKWTGVNGASSSLFLR